MIRKEEYWGQGERIPIQRKTVFVRLFNEKEIKGKNQRTDVLTASLDYQGC